jgi:predicted dehydrogenase
LLDNLIGQAVTPQRPLRFGILGAAHIVPKALIQPAHQLAEIEVLAIAARDPARARVFANTYRIPQVLRSYDQIIDAADIDAIYIPLPNSLHCEWTLRALRAGKHVLCEKPLASNEQEARQMADAAAATGLVLAEALHYRYHPLAARVHELLNAGTIGGIIRFDSHFSVPSSPADIRLDWDLAGGATMDLGCYLLDMVRYFSGLKAEVRRARAQVGPPNIDLTMEAELELENGASARISCSIASDARAQAWFTACGERGELLVTNLVAPQGGHRLTLRRGGRETVAVVEGGTTYLCQLRAFVAAVQQQQPIATPGSAGVANMRLIDEVYRAAGLPIRGPGPTSSAI